MKEELEQRWTAFVPKTLSIISFLETLYEPHLSSSVEFSSVYDRFVKSCLKNNCLSHSRKSFARELRLHKLRLRRTTVGKRSRLFVLGITPKQTPTQGGAPIV